MLTQVLGSEPDPDIPLQDALSQLSLILNDASVRQGDGKPNVGLLEGLQGLPRFKMAAMSFSGKERQLLKQQWADRRADCDEDTLSNLSRLQALYGL